MANSNILGIPQIGANQTNKSITHNNAVSFLEQSTNAKFSNTAVGAGPVSLTEAEATRNYRFSVSGGTANFDVQFPSQITGVNAQRHFLFTNDDTTHTATVKASTGAGTTVDVAPGASALIEQAYEDMETILSQAGTGTVATPYDLGLYVPAKPDDNGELLRFVAVRAFNLPNDFAASQMHVSVNPSLVAPFLVKRDGTTIGTISVATSGVATFTTIAAITEVFAIGERLSIHAPTPQDATLSGLSIVLAGTR